MNVARIRRILGVTRLAMHLRRDELSTPYDVVDFVMSESLIRPSQIPSELLQFACFVKGLQPRVILEIGTFLGGTLCVLSRMAHPDATIISLDLPSGYYSLRKHIWKLFPRNGQRLHLLKADSHAQGTVEKVRTLLNGLALDLLFIDGDHSYEGAKADFQNYARLVRPGGGIAFHDILPHPDFGVSRLWAEIRDFSAKEFVATTPGAGYGIGVITASPDLLSNSLASRLPAL